MTTCVDSSSKVVFLPFGTALEKSQQLCLHSQYLARVKKPQDLLLTNDENPFELSLHKIRCYKNKNLADEFQSLMGKISDAYITLQTRPSYFDQDHYKEAFKYIYDAVREQQHHLNGYSELKTDILPWNEIEQAIIEHNESILETQEAIFGALCNSLIHFYDLESETKQISFLVQQIQAATAPIIFVVAPRTALSEDLLQKLNRPCSIQEIKEHTQPTDKLHSSQGI